jgi:hypothetical protein
MNYGIQFGKIGKEKLRERERDNLYKRWLLQRAAGVCDLT